VSGDDATMPDIGKMYAQQNTWSGRQGGGTFAAATPQVLKQAYIFPPLDNNNPVLLYGIHRVEI
jgi:hypothetical protein